MYTLLDAASHFLYVTQPPYAYVYIFIFFSISTLASSSLFFFFNDTATTEIYTLSLHDALPIYRRRPRRSLTPKTQPRRRHPPDRHLPAGSRRADHPCVGLQQRRAAGGAGAVAGERSEEHTSELQSQFHLVCRLLLEKKKKKNHKLGQCSITKGGSYPPGWPSYRARTIDA